MAEIHSLSELEQRIAAEKAEIREQLNFRMRSGIYSEGFVHELACHWVLRIYNVFSIYDEIGILEGSVRRRSMTKPATKFKKPPIKGLWHKHHFQAQFIAHNLKDDIEKEGRLEELMAPYHGKFVEEIADELSHKLVIGNFLRRTQARIVTGEFIVYERRSDGSNYYLTLGEHDQWQEIRDRVDTYRAFDRQLGPT